MANTKNNLYSVGPGSIGPGTSVVRSVLNPRRESGVITRMHQDENGLSVSAIASLSTLSDPVFPGTAIPLDYTRIKQLSDTLALVVSYYGQGSSASGFRNVMTRSPSGYRQVPYWDVTDDYTSQVSNYVGNPKNGQLRPKYWLTLPLVTVRWSSTVFMDSRPNDNAGLIGNVNSNTYNIDGYSHAPETLKFGGTLIRHDKYSGYDRWTLSHSATYDPRGKHRSPDELLIGNFDTASGTYSFSLSSGGDGEQRNPMSNFPNLP